MQLIPSIPNVYESFPDDYINDVKGWSFDRATIEQNAGQLLTLDIDYGSRCSLNCPYCFRRDNSIDNKRHAMKFNDLVQLVEDAKSLGLKSIKFLGAGEPLENDGILDFLLILKKLDVVPVIFTKTGILADDRAVENMFSYLGIRTGLQLAEFLFECNVSIVQGFNSFDDQIQCDMCGGNPYVTKRRNRTIELLVKVGFASTMPTRLAIGINPITTSNIDEAFDIYKWARKRNIYAIVTPTMISGRSKGNAWKSITPTLNRLSELYSNIYRFNLETNLSTIDEIREDGISAYAGGHPCNQVASGLYVTLNGIVLSCPGSEDAIEGSIWSNSLKEIWINSSNYQRRGIFNCHCIAKDGKSIPLDLYETVAKEINIY